MPPNNPQEYAFQVLPQGSAAVFDSGGGYGEGWGLFSVCFFVF